MSDEITDIDREIADALTHGDVDVTRTLASGDCLWVGVERDTPEGSYDVALLRGTVYARTHMSHVAFAVEGARMVMLSRRVLEGMLDSR